MGRKTVLVLGAGASVADVSKRARKERPPLDRGFFKTTVSAESWPWQAHRVHEYMLETYGVDIFDAAHDSLEGVMGRLYPDLYNDRVGREALDAFRALLQLFNERLAKTTNRIKPTNKRLLYRMLAQLLGDGVEPGDITIVTFNQDLQVERTLEHMCQTARWSAYSDRLFSFPGLYGIDPASWAKVTWASKGNAFARSGATNECLLLLKLHGSLNWYSSHTSSRPTPSAMFNTNRPLSLTRRRTISPDMTLKGKRKMYTLPVVVPPVNHKSAVLPRALGPVWTLAEERIAAADDLVIFGYSCPQLDYESANLLARAHRARSPEATVSVIDPNGAVATRYIELLEPNRLTYYPSAANYLGDH